MLIAVATVIINSISSALKIVPRRHQRSRVHHDERITLLGVKERGRVQRIQTRNHCVQCLLRPLGSDWGID